MAKLVKKIGVYFISNILNAAIPFLLLPILTRKLSPSEYGEIAMFQTMVSALIAFVGLNAVGAANRKFYEDHSSDELKEYNGSCLQILLGSSIIVFFVFFIFSSQLVAYLSIPIGWIYSALLFSFLSFIINLRLGQWQIRGEAVKFGCLQISNSLFNMVGSLLLVVVLNYGAQGRIDAQIIAAGLAAASAAYFLIKDKLIILRCWRSDYIRDALYFGVPLVPHVLGFFCFHL
ncbi:lipopolysaccharide biosynthesis protein [Edwardsiella tarda]|uniref:lipopolysaccharide biosynthesis protein n=1 Tax=Edwardsiella tarda TaxID=636 RepID=UPI00351C621B